MAGASMQSPLIGADAAGEVGPGSALRPQSVRLDHHVIDASSRAKRAPSSLGRLP